MAKVGTWSTTAGNNNSATPDGWPEGQAPSTVNDCAREMMASLRTVFNDSQYVDQNLTPTYISATTFSVTGNQTSAIHANRRLKIFDATAGVATTIYATVVTASFTAVTTIQVSADAGQLTSSLSSFAIAILSRNNDSIPRGLSLTSALGLPLTTGVTGILPVANGGTGVAFATGSGTAVLATRPALTEPTITDYLETVLSTSAAATVTIDWANGTNQVLTTNQNLTVILPAPELGKSGTIDIVYGGAHTIAWSATAGLVQWPDNSAPAATSTLNKRDKFAFFCTHLSHTHASVIGLNYAA